MENLKNKITEILERNQVNETSSTGITGEKIIYSQQVPVIVDAITELIQIVFDPENQPNQLGIENPFPTKTNN